MTTPHSSPPRRISPCRRTRRRAYRCSLSSQMRGGTVALSTSCWLVTYRCLLVKSHQNNAGKILKLSSKKGAFIQSKVDTLGATCKHIKQTVVKLTTWRRTNRNIFETYRIESSALPSYSPSSFLFRVKHACVYIELWIFLRLCKPV